jgi:S1-C subfamily serine protease
MNRFQPCFRVLAALVASLGALPGAAWAERALPAEATVYIRLIGDVRIVRGEDERVWRERLLDLREMEVATGSGFIISPNGYVVTNHHVITEGTFTGLVGGQKITGSIDVNRIEVVLPSESAGSDPSARRFQATVHVSDPALDLAILYIGGQDLPYVALGDSDAIAPGDPVSAIGYPLGSQIEIGRARRADTVPSGSTTSGTLSARRTDDTGELRYLQLTAPLNPGNSGGPIVDAEGYAVGVAQLIAENANAVGFAVPINLVKRLILSSGIDQNLPSEILTLGPNFDAPRKGLQIRLPYGFEDFSPARLQVDTSQPDDALVLRIDRVASRWSLDQLESALLTGETLERFRASAQPRRVSRPGTRGLLAGQASGVNPDNGDEARILYAIMDLGREKIVARYIGSGEAVAINHSVLRSSLASVETRPLLVDEVSQAIAVTWVFTDQRFVGASLPVPENWLIEPGMPSACDRLPDPAGGLVASPSGDFTIAFRIAWRLDPGGDVRQAASGCSSSSSSRDGSYTSRFDWLGATYQMHGMFVRGANGTLWQLELVAPVEKARFLSGLYGEWVASVARQ